MEFVAVDVETANPDLASICQIGIASFRDGELIDTWESLVNPEDDFSSINVSIHGINHHNVQDAPTWLDLYDQISIRLQGKVVVSHTPFDRHALARACSRFNLTQREYAWLDSAWVVRRAWPEFSQSGYGLSNLAQHFGIRYRAHDALEDARCAGLLLVKAIAESGVSLEEWLCLVEQPIHENGSPRSNWVKYPSSAKRSGNREGDLFGEILVFTGSLLISRQRAADMASTAGCRVDDGVTKHTSMLVVGDQDIRMLNGHKKSSKHLKAERLIARGQAIRILGESDFMHIVSPQCERN